MKPDRVVIADFEAGLGTMSRSDSSQVDVAVIVVEPYMKSIETARRLIELVGTKEIAASYLVANKIAGDDDLDFVTSGLNGVEPDIVVPADDRIAEADLKAKAALDHAPDSPAVAAVLELAGLVAGREPAAAAAAAGKSQPI